MPATLLEKVWDAHTVRKLPNGQTQLFIGLHLIHEVTTPQAFDMLRARGLGVCDFRSGPSPPSITSCPTRDQRRPFLDVMAEDMLSALERNCRDARHPAARPRQRPAGHRARDRAGARADAAGDDDRVRRQPHVDARRVRRGRVRHRHVAGARRARVAVSGDGAASKVRRIAVRGRLARGVYAKDVILEIIRRLGVKGGVGYAYEYAGDTIDRMSMDERMTICNMSIEGGARVGYVNPDQTTFDYLRGRRFAPQGDAFERACAWWTRMASDCRRALRRRGGDRCRRDPADRDLGHQPGQSVCVDERCPAADASADRAAIAEALDFMGFRAGQPDQGHAHRRRVRRVVHERAPVGSARSRAGRARASTSRRTSRRWSCRARRPCAPRPSAKGSIASSSTPASTGAAPAARCASR